MRLRLARTEGLTLGTGGGAEASERLLTNLRLACGWLATLLDIRFTPDKSLYVRILSG